MASISPENERLLNDVVSSGNFRSADEAISMALRLLKKQTANGSSETSELLGSDDWIKEFDRITQSRSGGNPEMDDSRDSIYGDRN